MLMQARPLPPLLGLTDYLDEMVRSQGPRMRRRSGSDRWPGPAQSRHDRNNNGRRA